MRKIIKNMKVKHVLVIAVALSFALAYLVPVIQDTSGIEKSVTFIGILFGIIVGFFIADLYSRYQGIRTNAAIDASCLGTMHFFAQSLSKENNDTKWLTRFEDTIEDYIHTFMPLPWEEYGATEAKFSEIGGLLQEVKYEGDKSGKIFTHMLNVYDNHSSARENLIMYGKDKLSTGEWMATLFLGGLLLLAIFMTRDGSITSLLFSGGVASAIVILFIVIRDLNNLNFGESAIAVEPYERVLDNMQRPRFFDGNKHL